LRRRGQPRCNRLLREPPTKKIKWDRERRREKCWVTFLTIVKAERKRKCNIKENRALLKGTMNKGRWNLVRSNKGGGALYLTR